MDYSWIIIFALKLADCVFSTLKSVYMYKGKYAISGLFASIATAFFTVAIVQAAKAQDVVSILALIAATFIGTWAPPKLVERLEPERLFIYEITAYDMQSGQEYADRLRSNNIPVRTHKTYDSRRNKTLAIKAYSSSKAASKQIEDSMPDNFKWNVYSPTRDC